MKNTLRNISLLATLFFVPVISQAVVLFSDDFEGAGYTPGENIPTGVSENWYQADPAGIYTVQSDTSHLFSPGANQYGDLSITNSAVNMIIRTNDFTGTLNGQFSMEFYDPSAASHSGRGWSVRLGAYAGNGGTIFGVFIDNGNLILSSGSGVDPNGGTISTYSKDVVNSLDIVFNNASTSFSYSGGTLAAHTMDVYLNGTLVGDDLGGAGGQLTGVSIANLNFTAKADPFTGTLYTDNIVVDSSAAIPELSDYSLLAGLLGFTLVLFRRLRRSRG